MKTRPVYIHRGRRCQPSRAQVAVDAANTAFDARWLLVLLALTLWGLWAGYRLFRRVFPKPLAEKRPD